MALQTEFILLRSYPYVKVAVEQSILIKAAFVSFKKSHKKKFCVLIKRTLLTKKKLFKLRLDKTKTRKPRVVFAEFK